MGKLFTYTKDKLDDMKNSGVYKIKCLDCDAVYVDKCGWSIGTGVKEHCTSKLNNGKSFGIFPIVSKTIISLTSYIKLLLCQSKGQRLDFLEHLVIQSLLKTIFWSQLTKLSHPTGKLVRM